jgi:hypothetical protein
MLGVTLFLFPLKFSSFRIDRWKGAVLLAAYAVYLGVLLTGGPAVARGVLLNCEARCGGEVTCRYNGPDCTI